MNSYGLKINRNRCHDYGIAHGCDDGCQVLWDGGCEAIGEVIENINLNKSDLDEITKIYKMDEVNEKWT